MSALLHDVLSSRLAAEAGGNRTDSSSDEEVIEIRSGAVTPDMAGSSSPTIPTAQLHSMTISSAEAGRLPASSLSASSSDKRSASKAKRSKTDPLRVLPPELSQRIFLSLPLKSLFSCSLVCKRWRRSATLNYCWHQHVRLEATARQDTAGHLGNSTFQPELPPLGSGGAKWTRRESKVDWKTQWIKQRRTEAKDHERQEMLGAYVSANLLPGGNMSRSERLAESGYSTPRSRNEEKWEAEEREKGAMTPGGGFSKEEMRSWYKEQGGSKGGKIKGKRGKGGVKTGAEGDGGLWE